MAYERVQKSTQQSSSQKKQSRIVPPLIDRQTEADALPSLKVPVSGVKSKAERDAIRRSLFEKWAGAAPQPQSESEVLGHGGLSTETENIQAQQASQAKGKMGIEIQAKLTIGKPGDKYEQEADRVAAQVVNQINTPAPPPSAPNQSVQREAVTEEEDELQRKQEAGTIQREVLRDEEELQMKSIVQLQPSAGRMAAAPDLEASIQQARGGGQSLADNIRKPMEQAFGADFSGVKVHTDTRSDQLNQSIQARAFTTGQDVFFRQGEYNPRSLGGQELLAHELTHVVQQSGGAVQKELKDSILRSQEKVSLNHLASKKVIQCAFSDAVTRNDEQIYALIDPNTEEVYYIGRTRQNADDRKKQHDKKHPTTRAALTIKVIEKGKWTDFETATHEQYWINYYASGPYSLDNVVYSITENKFNDYVNQGRTDYDKRLVGTTWPQHF